MRYFIEPPEDDPNPRYPCGTCRRNVSKHMKAIKCDSCYFWNHIRCDEIVPYDYDKMLKLPLNEREKITHFCKICKADCFPFQKLSEEEFLTSIIKNIEYNEDLNLRVRPPEGIKRLFTDFSTLAKMNLWLSIAITMMPQPVFPAGINPIILCFT